jgi:hypothetical protein
MLATWSPYPSKRSFRKSVLKERIRNPLTFTVIYPNTGIYFCNKKPSSWYDIFMKITLLGMKPTILKGDLELIK